MKVHGQQSQLKQFRYSFIIFKKFINHINLYFIVIQIITLIFTFFIWFLSGVCQKLEPISLSLVCVCLFLKKKKKKKIIIQWGLVNQDPLDVGTFPCRGDLWLAFLRFYGVFSIRGRYECVAKSLEVMRKIFPFLWIYACRSRKGLWDLPLLFVSLVNRPLICRTDGDLSRCWLPIVIRLHLWPRRVRGAVATEEKTTQMETILDGERMILMERMILTERGQSRWRELS